MDIFEAARKRNLTAVKHLIEVDGIEPTIKNDQGDTVAHIATKNVDLNMLEYLVKKDPTIFNIRGHGDVSLFEIAIGINSMTLVKHFVDNFKADIKHVGDQKYPGTCVHFAAQMCNLEIFKYFIEEKNVDVNLKDIWLQPLAFAAARGSCLKIIKYIVEKCNANMDVTDALGRNIFCQSAITCDLTVPRYLLDEKKLEIDTNNVLIIEDAMRYTAQFSESNELEEFVKYFVEDKQMDINGGLTDTPLHHAAELGMLNIVKYLVRHGADIGRKDISGQTPLQKATKEDVIEYLKEMERKRSRRSLPIVPSAEETVCNFTRIKKLQVTQRACLSVDHPVVGRFSGFYSHDICSFLILASAFIGFRSQQQVLVPPQFSIETRIDPTVIDAIHDYESQ